MAYLKDIIVKFQFDAELDKSKKFENQIETLRKYYNSHSHNQKEEKEITESILARFEDILKEE